MVSLNLTSFVCSRLIFHSETDIISEFQSLNDYVESSGQSSSPYPSSSPAPSGFGIAASLIDADGWIRCADGLLLWIPEDCRHGLACPALVTIPTNGRHRRVRVDFTSFRCGSSWTEVHRGL